MSFEALLIFHFDFKSEFFASSGFLDCLIVFITLSIFSTLTDRPTKIWTRSSAFLRSNFVFFITTSSLKLKKFSKKSFKLQVLGLLSTIAKVLKPKELSTDVYL